MSKRHALLTVLLLPLLAPLGCSHESEQQRSRREQSLCPEARSLHCMAGKQCSYDRERKCEVCQCEQALGMPPQPPTSPSSGPPLNPR
jgi:hypothetical protein